MANPTLYARRASDLTNEAVAARRVEEERARRDKDMDARVTSSANVLNQLTIYNALPEVFFREIEPKILAAAQLGERECDYTIGGVEKAFASTPEHALKGMGLADVHYAQQLPAFLALMDYAVSPMVHTINPNIPTFAYVLRIFW